MKVEFETYQLKQNENANPILYNSIEDLELPIIDLQILKTIFPHNKHQLKTWGNISTSECHFIAVQKQTPLHTDKGFPKYTHHLILYVDNFILRGLDKQELPIQRGTYFVLDGHSPHQLLAKQKDARYYLAVSYDSQKFEHKDFVISKMIEYLKTANILENLDEKNL